MGLIDLSEVPHPVINNTLNTSTETISNNPPAPVDLLSLLNVALNNPYLVIFGIILLIAAGYLVIRKDLKGFQIKPLHEIFKEDIDALLGLLGHRSGSTLWRGPVKLGIVKKMLEYNKVDNQIDIDLVKETNTIATEEKQKSVPDPKYNKYWILHIRKDGLLEEILDLFGIAKYNYIVAEKKFFHKSNDHYFLDENQQLRLFGKVWIAGKNEYDLMSDFAWAYAAHDLVEQIINYSKKVSYLDARHSQDIEKYRAAAEVEKQKKRDSTTAGWT